MPHRMTRGRKPDPTFWERAFPNLKLVYRIECDLCGRTAMAAPCADDVQASAAFRGRGWRQRRQAAALLVVCRACARHLGPQWVDPDLAAAEAAGE